MSLSHKRNPVLAFTAIYHVLMKKAGQWVNSSVRVESSFITFAQESLGMRIGRRALTVQWRNKLVLVPQLLLCNENLVKKKFNEPGNLAEWSRSPLCG